MKRNRSIGELLYEDAMRRATDHNTIQHPKTTKFKTEKSEAILLTKFEQDLEAC